MYPAGTSLQRTRFMFAKDIKYTTYVIVAHTVLFFFFFIPCCGCLFFENLRNTKTKGQGFFYFL